jgi:hypothetical protein
MRRIKRSGLKVRQNWKAHGEMPVPQRQLAFFKSLSESEPQRIEVGV